VGGRASPVPHSTSPITIKRDLDCETTVSDAVRWNAVLKFESTARAARLYDLLADGPSWPEWFGPARRVDWVASRQDAPSAIRVRRVAIGRLVVHEAVLEQTRPCHHAYQVLTTIPVRRHRADVWFDAHDGGTTITWQMSFVPLVPGTGWLVGAGLKLGVSRLAHALIAAAETAPRLVS
jgi:hypothetical protein